MSMRLHKQKETYKSLLFTIGKLINTQYLMPIPDQPGQIDPKMSRMAIKQFYSKLLQKRSSVLSQRMHKIVVLSSLGNCGLVKPCLTLIEPYLKPQYNDRRPIPRVVRKAAFYALLNIAPRAPQRVRELVLPTLYERREDAELRIAAYEVFMQTQPGLSDLKLISQFVTNEPVRQVRSFIASHLTLLSLCKDRCLAPLALNVSRVLREVPAEIQSPEGLQFSRLWGLRLPMEQKIALMFGSLKLTPQNFLPRQVDVGMMAKALGLNIDVGRVLVRAEDAQRLLNRLLGPDGTIRTMRSLQSLLRPIVGRSKIDTDYLGGLVLYKGVYGISGLTKEVTDTLRKGLIPVSRDVYRLATRGGALERRIESLGYLDQVSKIPTAFGVPLTVNHTVTTHLKIKTNSLVKPKLLSRIGTAGLRIKFGASYRHEMRVGPDMTILRSYVSAMHQGHLPRTTAGIRVGWVNPKATARLDRLSYRINFERPQQDKKICHLSGHILTALWSQAQPNKPETKRMQHQTLPQPRKITKRVVTAKALGLALDYQYTLLNFTGMQPRLQTPFFGPRNIKVLLRRSSNIGDAKGVDFTFQWMLRRSNLRRAAFGDSLSSMNGTIEEDDLWSSVNETKTEVDREESNPTQDPPQMFSPEDSDEGETSDKPSHAFFSQSPKKEEIKSHSNSSDQPEFSSEMNDDQRNAFFASQGRLRSVLQQVVLRCESIFLKRCFFLTREIVLHAQYM